MQKRRTHDRYRREHSTPRSEAYRIREVLATPWLPKDDSNGKTKRAPSGVLTGPVKSAITYFPAEQYHRLQRLNFCVRDGNRCDPLHMVTDKSYLAVSDQAGLDS